MKYAMYELISKKRDGLALTRDEIFYIINEYVGDNIPDYQISALLMAVYLKGLNRNELDALTVAMRDSGDSISLSSVMGKKIDKHSTGGVGDKISFIVCPLVAACGVKVPMLSGRALGHTGGTLDKLEAIPGMNVFLNVDDYRDILAKCGMVISGQTKNIVPADRKLYSLRDATATVSSIPLISSSIMSKKLALETDGIVLDIKTGRGAFIQDLEKSLELCRTMVDLGEKSGRKTIGLITEMDEPLGYTVGNSLEIIESIEVLKGRGPKDLLEVSLALGACMLIAAEAATDTDDAYRKLQLSLSSGRALEVFREFIKLQNGNTAVCDDYSIFMKAEYEVPVKSDKDGYISSIDSLETGFTAVDIGAGRRVKEDKIDPSAGIIFKKKKGDHVKSGETIALICASDKSVTHKASDRLKAAVKITNEKPEESKLIKYIVDTSGVKVWG